MASKLTLTLHTEKGGQLMGPVACVLKGKKQKGRRFPPFLLALQLHGTIYGEVDTTPRALNI